MHGQQNVKRLNVRRVETVIALQVSLKQGYLEQLSDCHYLQCLLFEVFQHTVSRHITLHQLYDKCSQTCLHFTIYCNNDIKQDLPFYGPVVTIHSAVQTF